MQKLFLKYAFFYIFLTAFPIFAFAQNIQAPQVIPLPARTLADFITISSYVYPNGYDTYVYFQYNNDKGIYFSSPVQTVSGSESSSQVNYTFSKNSLEGGLWSYQVIAVNKNQLIKSNPVKFQVEDQSSARAITNNPSLNLSGQNNNLSASASTFRSFNFFGLNTGSGNYNALSSDFKNTAPSKIYDDSLQLFLIGDDKNFSSNSSEFTIFYKNTGLRSIDNLFIKVNLPMGVNYRGDYPLVNDGESNNLFIPVGTIIPSQVGKIFLSLYSNNQTPKQVLATIEVDAQYNSFGKTRMASSFLNLTLPAKSAFAAISFSGFSLFAFIFTPIFIFFVFYLSKKYFAKKTITGKAKINPVRSPIINNGTDVFFKNIGGPPANLPIMN